MGVDGKVLRGIIAEHEGLEGERQDLSAQQKGIIDDAQEKGFDKRVVKLLIRELRQRAKGVAVFEAEMALLDEYRQAYMRFETTPLGATVGKVTMTPGDPIAGVVEVFKTQAK